jgi:alkylation response protein AidB-like acyl-CoA dehydrogenase
VEVDEGRGGLGLGGVEVAVLAEELGRRAAPAPFLASVLALGALDRAGAREHVERLRAGGAIACVAWSRSPHAVRAERRGSGWVLRGTADPTPYAPAAALAVVVAADDDVPAVFVVTLDDERPAREPAMDLTRPLGWLVLDGVEAEPLGGPDAAGALLDRAAAFTCAEMLGGASRVLDMAVEYAKDRVQFGRPIGSFQAVKHRCADMLVDVEGMRSTSYWAAWCIGAGDRDASVAASTAKVWCADASKRVMASALQVHGGVGFTWEHDLHLFMKRAQLDQVLYGDAAYHRERLAALLRPRVEAGESVV